MHGVSNKVYKDKTGHSHTSLSIKSCICQFGAHGLGLEICVTLSVDFAARAFPVMPRNPTIFHNWITKGRKPVFCSNLFKWLVHNYVIIHVIMDYHKWCTIANAQMDVQKYVVRIQVVMITRSKLCHCAKIFYICHCAFSWSELRHTHRCGPSRLCLRFHMPRCFSRIWRIRDQRFILDQSYTSTDAAVVVARWPRNWRSKCRNRDYNNQAHWRIQVKIPKDIAQPQ